MESVEIRGNKTTGDLLREAGWFLLHTILAVLVLVVIVAAFWLAQADPDSSTPKMLCTALALIIPGVAGYFAARVTPDGIATHIWISGLLFFLVVCVYTLDLPTGNGLCNGCGAVDKLWRTFFSINKNSGLLGGDGLLIGTWIPLSMIGYAIGARLSGSAAEAD
jgi:hypothetical protein